MRGRVGVAALIVAGGVLNGGPAWAAADGKALFAAKCSSCHSKDAKGNPAMAKMFNVAPGALNISGGWTAEVEKSRAISLEKGKGKMPAFGEKLSAEERAAVIAFLKGGQESPPAGGAAVPAVSTAAAAKSMEAVPAATTSDGAGLFAKNCTSCHGKDGKGNPAMARMFKVEPSALDMTAAATATKSADALAGIISAGRGKMPAYKGKLSDGEVSAVVSYLKDGLKAAIPESERP